MALAVALATVGPRADSAAVLDAAGKLRTMREMGFPSAKAVGSLVAKNGDISEAIELAYQ